MPKTSDSDVAENLDVAPAPWSGPRTSPTLQQQVLGEVLHQMGGLLAVNTRGTLLLAATTAAHMAERGGVNAVRAGLLRSEATRFLTEDDTLRERYEQRVPLRRLGENRDVADAVHFLASPASAYVTAQVLTVDGGASTTAPSPTDAS